MSWGAEAPLELLSAMLRSWEDRFGARVVAFEHALLGDDNHRGQLHFADYANYLSGARHWRFWWD